MNKTILMVLALLLPLSLTAQSTSPNQVLKVQKTIKNSLKGTLEGVVKQPRKLQNQIRQYVFPRLENGSYPSNPWSKHQMPQKRAPQAFSLVPKGNPWAPVGDTQNIPFDQADFTGQEKNPYTDSKQAYQAPFNPATQFSTGSYNNFSNQFPQFNGGYNQPGFNSSNGAFSTPFGNNFFPSNQFWPIGNNNGSFPFMPW